MQYTIHPFNDNIYFMSVRIKFDHKYQIETSATRPLCCHVNKFCCHINELDATVSCATTFEKPWNVTVPP